MRKSLLVLTLLLLVSCNKDDGDSTQSVNGNVSYFFEIEFAGKKHKIEGHTSTVVPHETEGGGGADWANDCNSLASGYISLGISDKSAKNYVSGDNIFTELYISNASIGANTSQISFNYLMVDFIRSQHDIDYEVGSFKEQSSGKIGEITVTLTDLGSEIKANSSESCGEWPDKVYCFGNTIKGSYDDTLLFKKKSTSSYLNPDYSIAVPLKIKFSAVRFY